MKPQPVELKTLIALPDGWMKEFPSEAEANAYAQETKQPFVYHFAGNGKWYVAAVRK
jgi:hypothetical protein